MAMHFVEGPTLSAVLRLEGELPPSRTIGIVGQIASALEAAHETGLIHGDVKPGNILMEQPVRGGDTDRCYLSDFGLARAASQSLDLIDYGRLLGTVEYMAPELIEGQPADARTDVYSLGCVLYQCLVASTPFPRTTDLAVTYAHLEDPPPPVTARRPDLPPAIDHVIAVALSKDKDDRFSSCSEMVQVAAEALGEAAMAPSEWALPYASRPRPRRGVWRRALIAMVVVLMVTGAAAYWVRSTGDRAASRNPSPPASSPEVQAPAPDSVGRMFTVLLDGGQPHEVLTDLDVKRGFSLGPLGERVAYGALVGGDFDVFLRYVDGSGEPVNITNRLGTDGQPAWAPRHNWIAFVSDRAGGNFEIYLTTSSGNQVQRLTSNPGLDETPAWAPDGQRIAYASERDGNEDIYVLDVETGRPTRLTRDPATDSTPAWSPDGRRIVFSSDRNGNRDLYVISADGTGLARLTTDPARDQAPAWSPDGETIAFVSDRSGSRDIYLLGLASASTTRITADSGGEYHPVWSRDGSSLFFIATEGI